METISFEKITLKNKQAAAEILKESFNSVGQGWTIEESLKYIDRIIPYTCSLIAIIEDKYVGIVTAQANDDHVFVDAIGVLPDFTGQGIARALWKEVVEHAKQNNLKQIKMIADPHSEAFQWYSKLGFYETGWVEILKDI